ncbi:sensor histidine kinase [Cohnella thermotolerans]|uniref:sensor histidine kinase n=1 Tax=Cohnella thermotolerans TaxID=329858 RepID=UPI0004121FAF|nr:sensor histidine kinase [Cohnella thermotolerans]
MRSIRSLPMIPIIFILIVGAVLFVPPSRAHAQSKEAVIESWDVMWIGSEDAQSEIPPASGQWMPSRAGHAITNIPKGKVGMWVRIDVPPTSRWRSPGILVERLYGLDIAVYADQRLMFESQRHFIFERDKLLLPLGAKNVPAELYIRILSEKKAGLSSDIRIGELDSLSDRFIRRNLPDLLLGASITFVGLIMSLCSGYLNGRQRGPWLSLCTIALTTGILIATYSPLPYIYFPRFGNLFLILFDLSVFAMFPALNFYIGRVFDDTSALYAKFAKLQAGYSLFCVAVVLFYKVEGDRYFALYDLFTTTILGLLILVQMLFIIVLSVRNALKGNKDGILLSVGIFVLALSVALDMTLFLAKETQYVLFLWKFGVMAFIVTLVVILARRISSDYSKLVSYSKELELYNHRLQRSEKIKIISELAASVAHEVRNPLQVTRGFLQLLAGKAEEGNAQYFKMAIHELDRASNIITDFLTFAKPELDTVERLNLAEEISKIESIMNPLVAMHGGTLTVRIEENLFIQGNASKLKQAIINIVKNSVEALTADGWIRIEGYVENGTAVLRIEDNGEGIEPEQIAKLGEPFFSTKTKGTGLGLMVTFRIVEVMRGTLDFRSEKGKGTEAILRFPLDSSHSAPDALRT